MLSHESSSKSCPAINRVPRPRSINNETINKLIVARPRAPTWINPKMTALPKKVKLFKGIVNNPVTQVADVDVKKRSIKDIGLICAIGSASNNAPTIIRIKNEKIIMCAGDTSIILFLLIKTLVKPFFMLSSLALILILCTLIALLSYWGSLSGYFDKLSSKHCVHFLLRSSWICWRIKCYFNRFRMNACQDSTR